MVVVLPLLLRDILSLVILHSHVPWAAVPLSVVLKLVLLRWRVVERPILSEILIVIPLCSVVPVIVTVGSVILAIWRWSVVCKGSPIWRGSIIPSILVSTVIRGSVPSIVLVYIVLLSLC